MIVGSSSESCKRYKSNPTEWPTEKSGRKNYLPFSLLLHSFSCPWSISYLSSTAIEAGTKFVIFIATTFGIEPFSSTSHAQAHAPCQPFAGNTLQIALEPLPLVECPTQMNLVALDKYKTLPKAQRTRGLSSSCQSNFLQSYQKFKHKSWSHIIFRISTKHQ